jgi:hypothetical protein
MTEAYEFFPVHIKAQLPPLYSQEKNKDPTIYVKFFCPWSQWTWYATEGQVEGGDFLFFGYVVGHEREWGYFALSELESVSGPGGLKIERDIHFKPRKASQIADIYSHFKPKADGVQKWYCGYCKQDTPHEGSDCLACGNQEASPNANAESEASSSTEDKVNLLDCRVDTGG